MVDKPLYCSGCGKHQAEVESLIAMPGPMFICNECVELLHGQKRKTGDPVRLKIRE
jgi:ATP-dependent protease Clp ATPase subunit